MVTRRKKRRPTKRLKGVKRGKKAFGGYTINFQGCHDSLAKVFGNKPIPPSQMTKKLWAYVKKRKLNKR